MMTTPGCPNDRDSSVRVAWLASVIDRTAKGYPINPADRTAALELDGRDCQTGGMIRHPGSVNSKAEFLKFLEELRLDLDQNPDNWENPTFERCLEAMAAWVHASDAYRRH